MAHELGKSKIITAETLKTQNALARKRTLSQIAKQKATEQQWEFMRMAINAFAAQYPVHWMEFVKDIERGRQVTNPYSSAQEGDLKKSGFRSTGAFPVILNANGDEVDSLLPVLKKIIPGLTDKNSKNYAEFLKRFPVFRTSDSKGSASA